MLRWLQPQNEAPTGFHTSNSLKRTGKTWQVENGCLAHTWPQWIYTLLKQQYPKQNGLQDTAILSQHLKWKSSRSNFVQILHVAQNHWVCASNLSTADIVEVFDSLTATFSSTLITQVAAMLRCIKSKFTLRYIEVQHQNGADDCGLFVIAFTEVLCASKDPHLLSFDQKKWGSTCNLILRKEHH